jgi:aminoglycoside phosphotransferase (APT) family kinase protein
MRTRQTDESTVNPSALLDADDLPSYLRAGGLAPANAQITVTPMGGGISGVVLHARWDSGEVVVKQPMAALAVEDDWPFNRERALIERDCMLLIAERIPGAAPSVLFCDEQRLVLGMTAAPEGGVVWRDEHDAGVANPQRTELAAGLLARLHGFTAYDDRVRRTFAAQWPLIEGRIEPYHRTVALRHPDLAERIDEEVERLLATRRCLVHGDFSPKNLIAYPDRMVMLDFEVAHWGDPAFDVAFLLALVMLDGIRHRSQAFFDEAVRFWELYQRDAGPAAAESRDVIAELGCIMLARIDGKSRLASLDERSADRGRERARALLTDLRDASLEEALGACL